MDSSSLLPIIAELRERLTWEFLPRATNPCEVTALRIIDEKLRAMILDIERKDLEGPKRYTEISSFGEEISPTVIPIEVSRVLLKLQKHFISKTLSSEDQT